MKINLQKEILILNDSLVLHVAHFTFLFPRQLKQVEN